MNRFRLTFHFSSGEVQSTELSEGSYVAGAGVSDQIRLSGEGIAESHFQLTLSGGILKIDPAYSGVMVNGHQIEGAVEVEYPATIDLPGTTLVLEAVAGDAPRGDPAPQDDLAPLQGAYKLLKEIARGGMGRIYFAEDPIFKRQVAVKVSSVSAGGLDPRFAREAEVLAQLAHPNIVPVHAMGTDSLNRPYYSMKLVKGRTLQAVLHDLAKNDAATLSEYPLSALLTVFRKVCDAVAFAHSKGILHRDLKPENIMVGEYGEVLVMDWGLAKNVGALDTSATVREDSPALLAGEVGMTLEGDVMGTPQYMSPEQAEGMVAGLDQRSDIYSLGGILYAILTLRPPVDGETVDEVLRKVRKGAISAMGSRGGSGKVEMAGFSGAGRSVPVALQAVTLKAMARVREKRYASVEAFAADIEAFQSGFATSAEEAGAVKKLWLWIGRNKVLASSGAVLVLVVSGFTASLVAEGRRAAAALERLRSSAPTFAQRAEDAAQDGGLEEALEAATNAVDLRPDVGEYHRIRGNVLQVLLRWPEAVEEYRLAPGDPAAQKNLKLTEELRAEASQQGEVKARARLFEELNAQGRQLEAVALSKKLGNYWSDRKRDISAIPELVKRLEEKLLPVPGVNVLMGKTECTVGEWKLYIRAEGLPEWKQPEPDGFQQTDEHPVTNISWNDAFKFCRWLSDVTGKAWALPSNAEWEAAVGKTKYPWGDYFPPNADDGNYQIQEDGAVDPAKKGVDGIRGTAPAGSFKPNALGFYDLGGNVWECTHDGEGVGGSMRGSSWSALPHQSETRTYDSVYLDLTHPSFGFRIVRRKKDANAMSELVKRLEEKLLPVPGRQVFMTQTELTVGEWNLYLKAAGLPERRQDSADFAHQTDEHPVANLSWSAAMKFCEWLSKATGREWNLPSNAEWDAVAGKTKYPWGDYFPPNWDDGNYQIQRDGSEDPEKKGLDGIKGTSPVGSFKPNSLGFYDLGGNVWEWTRDGDDSRRNLRGSSWSALADQSLTSFRDEVKGDFVHPGFGFRVIRR